MYLNRGQVFRSLVPGGTLLLVYNHALSLSVSRIVEFLFRLLFHAPGENTIPSVSFARICFYSSPPLSFLLCPSTSFSLSSPPRRGDGGNFSCSCRKLIASSFCLFSLVVLINRRIGKDEKWKYYFFYYYL